MRDHMVNSQVRTADVTDERITRALRQIPRERFVPRAQIARAYSDRAIELTPIMGAEENNAQSRWMLSPRDFAKLIHSADIQESDAVLDIGCGRGYSSAVLSFLCDMVVGVELADSDVERATETLTDIGIENAAILQSDFVTAGAPHGPFDVIVAQGSVREIPQSWKEQLVDGGRIAVVVMDGPVGRATVFRKSGDALSGYVAFDATVPVLPGFEPVPEFVF